MNNFEKVDKIFGGLPYMCRRQASLMRDLIVKYDAREILEIGFFHGKSSAYFAAILEDLGRGHLLTIDKNNARSYDPGIDKVLSTLGLAHRVTPVFAHRSYTWELGKMLRATPRPTFDLCYFDGGHTWDPTGFGFLLVDMLLRPGGWIVFDDLDWTVEEASRLQKTMPRSWRACSPDERIAPAVRMVFDLLVPHLGYTSRRIVNHGRWGIAQKPIDSERQQASTPAALRRLLKAFKGR